MTNNVNNGTATCIGLSAVRLLKKDQDAVMIVLPSDHYIKDEQEYVNTLAQAIELANRKKVIVTLGIEPTRPEIGYGYIEMGERISGDIATYKVARFTEKPNLDVAKEFIFTGNYLWNSGMFVFRADIILREIEKYLPNVYNSLMEIYRHIGEEDQDKVIFEEYERINGISIDFGVMQRTRKACVIKCNFQWDDIGSFTALSRFLQRKESNYTSKNAFLEDCENCAVFGGKNLVIGLGVKDLVIVDAGDVLLVMDKKRDQEIKHLLTKLEAERQYKKYL